MSRKDTWAQNAAKTVMVRIEEVRRLTDAAMRDVSVPEPDFIACRAHIEMARDILPTITEAGEVL